jgi:methionine-rich copper-binding protein CopC
MTPWIRRARFAALGVALVTSFVAPLSVSAHAEVVTATPAQGSIVAPPVGQVVVTYSEALSADSRLGILDASGNRVAIGMPDPADDHRMVATLDPALSAGTYTVRSTSISSEDGDLDRQQWTFGIAVSGPEPSTPEPTPVCTDGCNGQSTDALATPTPTAASTAPSPSASTPPDATPASGTDAVVPIVAALAIVALGGVFLMTRGRRSGTRP